MATEIERKFLVSGTIPAGDETHMLQAYLNFDPQRTVRVRIGDDSATLTIKGKTEGISRAEFEYPIPLDDARSLLDLAVGSVIEKTRRRVLVGEHTWEVDTFAGANRGLVVAEIELSSESEQFDKPEWVGDEVSGDKRYLNSLLAQHPFTDW